MDLMASAAAARQILEYFDRIGLDERHLSVGYIDPALRRPGPLRVSARLPFDLLEEAAEHLGQSDVGLRHAIELNLRGLDAISLLWDHTESVAAWYALARKYVHLENNALHYDLAREGNDVALIHGVLPVLAPHATQGMFTFVAMTARVFREVFGRSWVPQRVEFTYRRPTDTRLFRSFFRCRIEWEATRNALVVTTKDFGKPLLRRNPELVRFFESQLRRQSEMQATDTSDVVLGILMSGLAGGPPSLAQVARRLSMSKRTLQRRLAASGTRFVDLLTHARKEIATAHQRGSPRATLSRLAFELGLSDATAASRFLRTRMKSQRVDGREDVIGISANRPTLRRLSSTGG